MSTEAAVGDVEREETEDVARALGCRVVTFTRGPGLVAIGLVAADE